MYLTVGFGSPSDSDSFEWDWRFTFVSFGVCLIARAFVTFPICYLAGLWRQRPIPFKYMIVIWFSGLRGAIAFALSLNVKNISHSNHAAIIRSSTIFTILTTTIVNGLFVCCDAQRERITIRLLIYSCVMFVVALHDGDAATGANIGIGTHVSRTCPRTPPLGRR